MASKPTQTVGRDESFWREFPALTGYFAPGMVPLLKYLDLDSKQVMHEFGEQVGRKAAGLAGERDRLPFGRKPQPNDHSDF